jgi:hypothetical protein
VAGRNFCITSVNGHAMASAINPPSRQMQPAS